MTRAILLCAGFGTRLGALSDERPKPLLPVCNRPIVEHGIELLVAHGIRDIVINVHHKANMFEDLLGDGARLGARIQYSHEDSILGTGGGIRNALPLLDPDGDDEPFIAMNGKLIIDADVSGIIHYAKSTSSIGTLVVRRVPNAQQWNALRVESRAGRAFVTDIFGDGEHMFCGIQVVRPSVIRRLPPGESCSIRQGYLPWIRSGESVAAYELEDGYFNDHSTPERYWQSNMDLVVKAGTVRIAPSATIEPGAQVGERVIIGSNATIRAGAVISDSVVWPNAVVQGTVCNSIVTPTLVVSVESAP